MFFGLATELEEGGACANDGFRIVMTEGNGRASAYFKDQNTPKLNPAGGCTRAPAVL